MTTAAAAAAAAAAVSLPPLCVGVCTRDDGGIFTQNPLLAASRLRSLTLLRWDVSYTLFGRPTDFSHCQALYFLPPCLSRSSSVPASTFRLASGQRAPGRKEGREERWKKTGAIAAGSHSCRSVYVKVFTLFLMTMAAK